MLISDIVLASMFVHWSNYHRFGNLCVVNFCVLICVIVFLWSKIATKIFYGIELILRSQVYGGLEQH